MFGKGIKLGGEVLRRGLKSFNALVKDFEGFRS